MTFYFWYKIGWVNFNFYFFHNLLTYMPNNILVDKKKKKIPNTAHIFIGEYYFYGKRLRVYFWKLCAFSLFSPRNILRLKISCESLDYHFNGEVLTGTCLHFFRGMLLAKFWFCALGYYHFIIFFNRVIYKNCHLACVNVRKTEIKATSDLKIDLFA